MHDQQALSTTQLEEAKPSSRRRFLKRVLRTSTAVAVGVGVYAWRFEPHWLEITHRVMPLAKLPAPLIGKRVVQLSDLHVGPVVDGDYLRRVCRQVVALEPDYLVLTGDFMTSHAAEQIERTLDTLRELPLKNTPTLATLGNHDYGHAFRDVETANRLTEGLRRLGIHVLRNETLEVDGLQFAGCDDLWSGEHNLAKTFEQFDDTRAGIVMAHNPDLVDQPGWGAFKGWILSGHTHGGQCWLPLIGAPVVPIRNHAYCSGHIRLGAQRDLYVNRGIGYKRRLRFAVRPEVTVFELATV